jgi:hypothetical protein
MFRRLLRRKRVLSVLGIVGVLALAGLAFGYWTTTGSGSGSGSVAASNGTLTLHGTITSALTPGGSSPVTFTADNASSSSLQVGTIHAVVSIGESGAGEAHEGCEASDFTIADTVENQTIPATTSGVALTTNGSISMADTNANQDACKGAPITLTLTS